MKENKKDLCLFSIITLLRGELTAAFCPPETIQPFTNNCMNLDWVRDEQRGTTSFHGNEGMKLNKSQLKKK